jgi:phosphoglucosamine mutase
MGKYFGTDGIRGVANETLDVRLAYRTGFAAANELAVEGRTHRPRVLICKDTRISSDMLEAAIIAGLCSGGADVVPLGVLPTPAAAYLTMETGADMGVVISASHNPFEHNGIKLFNSNGYKLPDGLEARIEASIDAADTLRVKTRGEIGRVLRDDGRGEAQYVEHVASKAGHITRRKIVVDCSNGAAYRTARRLFELFDLDVEYIHDTPDGVNINDNCGSTNITSLQSVVRALNCDCGFAFDGDADRCLMVDENGDLVDGDVILALCAASMKRAGTLRGGAVVGTIVSNSGLGEFGAREGIEILRADVGDRNVLELMQSRGCNLGGETSGHTIFLDDSTTGDGQLAALKILTLLSETGATPSGLRRSVPNYPQVIINVPVDGAEGKTAVMTNPKVADWAEAEERELAGAGMVLIRPSGTEPVVRVTVEAKTRKIAEDCALKLANLLKSL